ncbi:natural killer cell receptor 2B4-like [Carassius auratus]|uniref:Natural killer cell receptor 2B4-like n=1 Tax=Carassius auratus TaxID=7957 RepID=A0A6P6J3F6_CARAU|nr:natural killer cell receptor 2B4-like [Carassius auratus]
MEGDSATLNTDLTEIREDDILWKFGVKNSLIAQINRNNQTILTYDDGADDRFRDRLKVDHQTGSLTITDITTEHAGLYTLDIIGVKSKTFSVSVYAHLPVPVTRRDCTSSSSSQQNCSLLCSVVNVGHVTLSWYKGNSLLSSISVSDLSISLSLPLEVEYQEKNSYSCVINNPITNQTTHLDISKLCHTCSGFGSLIFRICIAGSLLIVAAVGMFCWKRRKTNQKVQTRTEEITYIDPIFHKRNAQKSHVKKGDHVDYAPVVMRK